MSKRYGRNKKRRHAAETALLRDALRMTEGLLEYTSEKRDAAEATVRDMVRIIEAVSRYSVAVPVKEEAARSASDHVQLEVIPRIKFSDIVQAGDTAPMYQRVSLYALRVFLEENAEAFQTAVHLRYAAGGRSVYMISEKALRAVPEEFLTRDLALEISTALVRLLRRGR